jgi:adenylate cyclase class IV
VSKSKLTSEVDIQLTFESETVQILEHLKFFAASVFINKKKNAFTRNQRPQVSAANWQFEDKNNVLTCF